MRTYSELITIDSYIERYRYLKIGGKAGEATFGNERYLNQILYKSDEWKACRRKAILRDFNKSKDFCCDMAFQPVPILGIVVVHHLNPITIEDILNNNPLVFDLENLVSVSATTHRAIHYGDENLLMHSAIVERTPNDTTLWR